MHQIVYTHAHPGCLHRGADRLLRACCSVGCRRWAS